jgi:hypothetical protein
LIFDFEIFYLFVCFVFVQISQRAASAQFEALLAFTDNYSQRIGSLTFSVISSRTSRQARRAREELQQERERLAQERRQAENERFLEEQRRQNQRMINESWRRP